MFTPSFLYSTMNPITYIAIAPDELDRVLRNASRMTGLVRAEDAADIFKVSKDSINKLAKLGKIRTYENASIRGAWYKVEEIEKTFKPIR